MFMNRRDRKRQEREVEQEIYESLSALGIPDLYRAKSLARHSMTPRELIRFEKQVNKTITIKRKEQRALKNLQTHYA